MQFKEGTQVETQDGESAGQINRVVLDPSTGVVTHIVVQEGLLFPEDKVVPVDRVEAAGEDRIRLQMDEDELEELPPFEETHYINLGVKDVDPAAHTSYTSPPAYYWYPPYGWTFPGYGGYPGTTDYPLYGAPRAGVEIERNIPEGTVPLEQGADVISADGEHVGDVEQVLTEPNTNQATHFLISKGFLFKERKLVPFHWVKTVRENRIYLVVDSKLLERLPDYQE